MSALTQERLRQLLDYDPDTGVFTWRACACRRIRAGTPAGGALGSYTRIVIDYRSHAAHRLAFLYCTGEMPIGEVDHIDGNGFNNSWVNLRDCNRSQNQQNRAVKKSSRSGLIGVTTLKTGYQAFIQLNGNKVYLGRYSTAQAAHQAYCEAKYNAHTFNPIPRTERVE